MHTSSSEIPTSVLNIAVDELLDYDKGAYVYIPDIDICVGSSYYLNMANRHPRLIDEYEVLFDENAKLTSSVKPNEGFSINIAINKHLNGNGVSVIYATRWHIFTCGKTH